MVRYRVRVVSHGDCGHRVVRSGPAMAAVRRGAVWPSSTARRYSRTGGPVRPDLGLLRRCSRDSRRIVRLESRHGPAGTRLSTGAPAGGIRGRRSAPGVCVGVPFGRGVALLAKPKNTPGLLSTKARGASLMVGQKLPKLLTRVRFPRPALL